LKNNGQKIFEKNGQKIFEKLPLKPYTLIFRNICRVLKRLGRQIKSL